MSRDRKSQHPAEGMLVPFDGHASPGRGMVAAARPLSANVSLELGRDLADIVQPPRDPGDFSPAKGRR
jgi:hypothetical protein